MFPPEILNLRPRKFHFPKYKKNFFLRKYKKLFNFRAKKFHFTKYKKNLFRENIRKFHFLKYKKNFFLGEI